MIIDAHVHIWKRTMLPDVMMEAYLEPLILLDQMFFGGKPGEKDWLAAETEPGEPVKTMDLAKIDRSVVLPLDFGLVGPVRDTVEQYNDWVFEYCAGFGDRLIPFVGVDPQRGPEALRLVNKYVKSFDAKGVKVYPSTGWRPDDPKMAPFFDLIDDLGLVLVTHAGAGWGPLNDELARPELFQVVMDKRESMRLVVAHLGGKYRDELYRLASRNPNVYADCSALQGWLPSHPETAEARLKEASERMPERVVFGSDWPLFDLAYCQSNWVEFVQERKWGTDEAKERLLSGNFLKMIRS
jgi:predicted TIM-barrel fold metal-dependent hydrolase